MFWAVLAWEARRFWGFAIAPTLMTCRGRSRFRIVKFNLGPRNKSRNDNREQQACPCGVVVPVVYAGFHTA